MHQSSLWLLASMKKGCWYPLTFNLENLYTNRRVLGQNKWLNRLEYLPCFIVVFIPFCSFLPTLFSIHPVGEGEKLKQDKQPLINAQCPQGQGSIHWLILADGNSENNFNWLAVNMPTAHILSQGTGKRPGITMNSEVIVNDLQRTKGVCQC